MKKSYHSSELPSNPAPSSLRQFLLNAASSRSSSKRNAVLPMAAMVSPLTPQGSWNDRLSAYPAGKHSNAQRVRSRTTEATDSCAPSSRMADVTIFTQRFCGCCADAKRLLRKKGVAFREVPTRESGGRAGLRSRFGPGAGTFPQVVINGRHVGGASDLAALDASGELDRLLAGATSQPSRDVDRPARPADSR